MTSPSLPPPALDAELTALLDRERTDPAFEASRARLARRLECTAAALAATAGGGLLGASTGAVRTEAAGALARGTAQTVGKAAATKAALAALLFVAGGVVGAGLQAHHDASRMPEPPAVTAVSQTPVSGATAPGEPTSLASAPVPVFDVGALPRQAPTIPSSVTRPAAASASTADRDRPTSLGEEQRLLDTARAAVGRGAFSAALTSLAEHEARFANGRLVEERELLMVQALAGSGRAEEAKARAARFEARFPGSIFLPAVRQGSAIQSR
jgi:hypothetical protein